MFYKRYVDDCILAIPRGEEQVVLNSFNSFHRKLQFTLEVEENSQINFLDITLIKHKNKILTKWYTKSVSSGRYLNFNSEHHITHKKNVITAIIDRAIKLTSPSYRKDSINKAKTLLTENNYPIEMINKIVKKRTHAFYNSLDFTKKLTEKQSQSYFPIPYVSQLSEKIEKIFRHHNINIAHKSQCHTKQYFTKLKSKTRKLKQTHIVYKIPCSDCDKVYYGQSAQYLQERLKAHKYAKTASTALNKHKIDTGHNFNYHETSIVTSEKNTYKRNILEMIHINADKNSVNNNSEINNLSKIYQVILK